MNDGTNNTGKSVHLTIRGRVQGVWFRASACERARSLGLVGWVRNREDGAVEAEAAGTDTAIDAFVAWCRVGPPRARVEGVEVTPRPISNATGFDVR